MDPIEEADRPFVKTPPRYLVPHPSTFANYSCCPWAKSILSRDHETGSMVLSPVTCKRWGCSYCAPRKIRKLAFLTNGAKPNRWIRLGVKPERYTSPKEAWEATADQLPEAVRKLRINLGEIEYLRVCELHVSGFPHYHALLRAPFIPQKMLSNIWGQLTGAPVVWIAKIDQSFSSFRYLTKYLTKLHRIEWTDRHVAYSRNFFREEDREKLAYPVRDVEQRIDDHPWKYLSDHYPAEEIALNENGSFTLPHDPGVAQFDTPVAAFNFAGHVPDAWSEDPQDRYTPQYLPGMQDAERPVYS